MPQDNKTAEENYNIPCRDTGQGTETARRPSPKPTLFIDKGLPNGQANMFAAPLRSSPGHCTPLPPGRVETMRCADLVEKLRAYTLAKNFNKSSCHSKNAKSIIREMIYDSLPTTKVPHKNTFRPSTTRSPEIGEAIQRGHSNLNSEHYGIGRRERSRSPGHVADVRYLCDVTKCLTDTIKQFIDQSTSMTCPGEFLRRQLENQQPSTSQTRKPCNCCRVPKTCTCGSNNTCTCVCKSKKLETEITKWAESIPVYPNQSLAKQNLRDNMMKEFIETAKSMEASLPREEFKNKLREKAKNMLNCLPMWQPEGEEEREEFKQKLLEDLGKTLEKIAPASQSESDQPKNQNGSSGDSLTDQVMRGNDFDSRPGVSGAGRRGISSSSRTDGTRSPDRLHRSMSEESEFDTSEFERAAEEEILDYIDPIVVNKSEPARKKHQIMAKELANKAKEIMFEPGLNRGEQDETIKDNVAQFFRRLSIDMPKQRNELVDGLSDKLKRLVLSTPKRHKHRDGFQSRGLDDTTMSSITDDAIDFEKAAEQEILNYTDPLVANKSMPARQKRQAMAKELARKAKEIMFEPEQESGEQEGMIRDELSQFFRKLSLDTPKQKEELIGDLSDKFKRLIKGNMVGFGKRDLDDSTMSSETSDALEYEGAAEQEILNYIKPIVKNKSMASRNKSEAMAKEMARKAKEIMFEPEQESGEREGMIRDELLQFFRKLSYDTTKKTEVLVNDLSDKLNRLFVSTPRTDRDGHPEYEKELKVLVKQQKAAEVNYLRQLDDAISSWIDGLPVNMNITVEGDNLKESVKQKLAEDLMDRQKYNQLHPKSKPTDTEELDLLKYQIFKRLNNKLEPKDVSVIVPRAEELLKKLKSVNPPDFTKLRDLEKTIAERKRIPRVAGEGRYKVPLGIGGDPAEGIAGPSGPTVGGRAAYPGVAVAGKDAGSNTQSSGIDGEVDPDEIDSYSVFGAGSKNELFAKVGKWVNDLPIPSKTPEEKEKVDNMKQELANKLITKIGALHMDPHILNDDYTYESIVEDEIDQVLEDLPQIPEIVQKKEELKADLIGKVKETQQKAKEELSGQIFKQQLKDVVTKNLPKVETANKNDQAALEIVKDDIADALVNMHYEPDDYRRKELQKNLDEKIKNFTDEMEKIKPGTKIDKEKIKRDLVTEIKNIPVPNKELVKTEVEQVRIKEEIKDWAKELPMNPDVGPEEQMKASKMVALTAKKLQKIEKDKELNPNVIYDKVAQKEIAKLIKKLPIKHADVNVPEITENLIARLKDTKENRQMKGEPRSDLIPGYETQNSEDDDDFSTCAIPPCLQPPCRRTPPCTPQPCNPPPCYRSTQFQIPCEPPHLPSPCMASHDPRPTWLPRSNKPKYTSRNMSCDSPPCRYQPKKHDCLNQKPCDRSQFLRPNCHVTRPRDRTDEAESQFLRPNCHLTRPHEAENRDDDSGRNFEDDQSQSGQKFGKSCDRRHNCNSRPRTASPHDEEVARCPRCCGMNCPHPSHLYFRS